MAKVGESKVLEGFLGFFVVVLFCFLNGKISSMFTY